MWMFFSQPLRNSIGHWKPDKAKEETVVRFSKFNAVIVNSFFKYSHHWHFVMTCVCDSVIVWSSFRYLSPLIWLLHNGNIKEHALLFPQYVITYFHPNYCSTGKNAGINTCGTPKQPTVSRGHEVSQDKIKDICLFEILKAFLIGNYYNVTILFL